MATAEIWNWPVATSAHRRTCPYVPPEDSCRAPPGPGLDPGAEITATINGSTGSPKRRIPSRSGPTLVSRSGEGGPLTAYATIEARTQDAGVQLGGVGICSTWPTRPPAAGSTASNVLPMTADGDHPPQNSRASPLQQQGSGIGSEGESACQQTTAAVALVGQRTGGRDRNPIVPAAAPGVVAADGRPRPRWALAELLRMLGQPLLRDVEMKVGISAPPAGIAPEGEAERVPRSQVSIDLLKSPCPSRTGPPGSLDRPPVRRWLRPTGLSGAKMPTATTTMSMPSPSCGHPKSEPGLTAGRYPVRSAQMARPIAEMNPRSRSCRAPPSTAMKAAASPRSTPGRTREMANRVTIGANKASPGCRWCGHPEPSAAQASAWRPCHLGHAGCPRSQ